MGKRVRVLVVEDSVLQQRGICSEIMEFKESPYDFEVKLCIKSAKNAIVSCLRGDFDLILMDVFTEGEETGIDAAREIKAMHPNIRIIMMTGTLEGDSLLKSRAIGCDSFWQKDSGKIGLQRLMEKTMDGEGYYPEELPCVYIGNAKSSELTQIELNILREVAVIHSQETVARRLNISVNTLKYHLKMIRDKTGMKSTLLVVSDAIRKQVIIPRIVRQEQL